MADYTQDQDSAYEDILEAGTLATLSRITSTYDPTEGAKTVTGIQTDSVAVVTFPASQGTIQAFDNRIIEEYKQGKVRFFYMAGKGLTFEPKSGDLLFFDSTVWDVAGATGLNPDGTTPILYTIGVKPSSLSALPTVP